MKKNGNTKTVHASTVKLEKDGSYTLSGRTAKHVLATAKRLRVSPETAFNLILAAELPGPLIVEVAASPKIAKALHGAFTYFARLSFDAGREPAKA